MGDFWEVAMSFLSVVRRGGLQGVKLCIYLRAEHAHHGPPGNLNICLNQVLNLSLVCIIDLTH
jgi:hypothetical protein